MTEALEQARVSGGGSGTKSESASAGVIVVRDLVGKGVVLEKLAGKPL